MPQLVDEFEVVPVVAFDDASANVDEHAGRHARHAEPRSHGAGPIFDDREARLDLLDDAIARLRWSEKFTPMKSTWPPTSLRTNSTFRSSPSQSRHHDAKNRITVGRPVGPGTTIFS